MVGFKRFNLKSSNPVACCYGYGYALKKETDNFVNSTFDGCIKMFSSDQKFSWPVNWIFPKPSCSCAATEGEKRKLHQNVNINIYPEKYWT